MHERLNIPRENHTSYIHFTDIISCDTFIRRFGESYIKSRCCSGTGFGYPNTIINNERINEIRNSMNNNNNNDILRDYPVRRITRNENEISREVIRTYPVRAELHTQECCVCYELNSHYTACAHSLCLRCNNNLPYRLCPMCRSVLP